MSIEEIKRVIESHETFKKYFTLTGEDYSAALDLWIPQYHYLVDVYSEGEASILINKINKIKV